LSFGRGFSFEPASIMPKSVIGLIVANVVCFFAIQFDPLREWAYDYLYLHTDTFSPWQMVSYMFFHADGGHLFFNLLSLFLFGASVEREFSSGQFLKFYFSCGAGAALFSYVFGFFVDMGPVLGASGAIFGLYYACYKFFPDAIVHVWFVLPIKLKYLLILMGVFSFLMMFDPSSNVAHIAHLGGLLSGILWFRYNDSFLIMKDSWESQKEERWEKDDKSVKGEVDRILEKISQDGMGALTKQEKKFLSTASRRFKK
jgi:membrane associated rhomboid family serine protease